MCEFITLLFKSAGIVTCIFICVSECWRFTFGSKRENELKDQLEFEKLITKGKIQELNIEKQSNEANRKRCKAFEEGYNSLQEQLNAEQSYREGKFKSIAQLNLLLEGRDKEIKRLKDLLSTTVPIQYAEDCFKNYQDKIKKLEAMCKKNKKKKS